MGYAELHTHSFYSFLEGASSPEELAGQAKELGYESIALTDRCSLYGAIPFYQEAKALGIHPIIGSQMDMSSGEMILLLCKDSRGYSHLSELITRSRRGREKGRFLTYRKDLEELSPGLICLVGGKEGKFSSLVSEGKEGEVKSLLSFYQDLFAPDSLYLELTRHLEAGENRLIYCLWELSREFGIPCVATNAARYHSQDKARLCDILCCIREGVLLKDSHEIRFGNHERGLKSPEEMRELFAEFPDVLSNSEVIAGKCRVDLEFSAYRFPQFPVPDGYDAHTFLKHLCEKYLSRKYPRILPRHTLRMQEELDLIRAKQLSGYFLVVWDLVRFANSRGIPCQGRGSAANSLVAYLLEIAPVDPIEHDLFFGRFLNEETKVIPDIDLDFASTAETEREHREDVIQYVYRKYGEDYVAMACTFITYRPKSAIREVGKVLEMPEKLLDKMAKLGSRYSLPDAFTELAGMEEFSPYLESSVWSHFRQLVTQILDLPRHLSIHTGGMVISSPPLHRLVPLEPARMPGRVVCQWDKDMIEDAGLVKVDLLGLRMLSALRECVSLIEESEGEKVDLETIKQDDPQVYEMISRADTVGVFQVESRAQMQSLTRTRPRNLKELGIQVAIIRPGPLQGNMVNPYIRRRNGEEEVTQLHPSLEPILSETLGVILFQEQVLKVAVTIAGFSCGQAEMLRKAMSKKRSKQAMEALKEDFLQGSRKKGVSEDDALRIYQTLDGFALYGFCKSHAMAFAKIAYQSAWLRKYHPACFTTALLNHQPMGFYPREVLLQDVKRQGIQVFPVCVQESKVWCHVSGGMIRLGLMMVKGMKRELALDIVKERQKRVFLSLFDFLRRVRVGGDLLQRMIQSGSLDSLVSSRREALWKGWLYAKGGEGGALISREPEAPELPQTNDWSAMQGEYSSMGFSVSMHPIGLLRETLKKRGVLSSGRLSLVREGREVRVAGMVVCRQRPPTAKGFGFLTLEDEEGMINLVIPPDPLQRYKILFQRSGFVIARGRKMSKNGVVNIRVNQLQELQPAQTMDLENSIRSKVKSFS